MTPGSRLRASRWLSALMVPYVRGIERLLHARDAAVEAWQASHPDHNNVYEDRRLEVSSEFDSDIEARVQQLERQLARG